MASQPIPEIIRQIKSRSCSAVKKVENSNPKIISQIPFIAQKTNINDSSLINRATMKKSIAFQNHESQSMNLINQQQKTDFKKINKVQVYEGNPRQITEQSIKPFNSSSTVYTSSVCQNTTINISQLCQNLKSGNMEAFLRLIEKKFSQSPQDRQQIQFLKNQFVRHSQFYKKLKQIACGGYDSRVLYADKSFYFFEEVPKIFNRIIQQLASKFQLFESFNKGSKLYLSDSKNDQIEKNYGLFFTKVEEMRKEFTKIIRELKNLKQENEKLQQQKKQLEKSKKKIESKLLMASKAQQSSNNVHNLQTQITILTEKNEKLQKKVSQYQTITERLKNQLIKFQEEIKRINLINSELNNKLTQADNQIKHLQDQILLNQKQFTNRIQSSASNLEEVQKIKQELFNKSKELNEQRRLNNSLEKKISQLTFELTQQQQKCKQMNKNFQVNVFNYLLQSSDLVQYKDTQLKANLFGMLQHYTSRKPLQFKLLFKFRSGTSSNFYQYIYKVPNLLILIKLANNVVIGGYSPVGIQRGVISNVGFLCSLTTNKLYPLIPSKPCFLFDDFYLNLGNSDIRIQVNSDKLYSGFGMPNSYFQSGKDNLSQFFNGGNDYGNIPREVQMARYEFYHVSFE